MGAVAVHESLSFSPGAALRRCLTENARRGKRQVGEPEAPGNRELPPGRAARLASASPDLEQEDVATDLAPCPGALGMGSGGWVSLPIRVKFIVTSCAKWLQQAWTAQTEALWQANQTI
jgi:hypothetical protein